MSVTIKDNVITATRGDTVRTKIGIKNADGTDYVPSETDTITFGLKKTINDEECLFKVDIPYDTLELIIESERTKGLEYGNYLYDIQLETAEGFVTTFITYTGFTITGEVV